MGEMGQHNLMENGSMGRDPSNFFRTGCAVVAHSRAIFASAL